MPVSERPKGGALFARVRGDAVIAPKLDRLFRSALDALKVVDDLRRRAVSLCLLDLGGDISGNGLSKLFLTIAAAFAEAERDRIKERVSQSKADQKARGRYLGGTVPFGYRRGESGELVPHEGEQEAIRDMVALRAQGRPLRAIAEAVRAKGVKISHDGVAGVLKSQRAVQGHRTICSKLYAKGDAGRRGCERTKPEARTILPPLPASEQKVRLQAPSRIAF